ncbi:MAG: S8 family serine peptidase [Oligoflexia bacterium]|nr:S8 family serine peptidase [Oligoflexia bacterium]
MALFVSGVLFLIIGFSFPAHAECLDADKIPNTFVVRLKKPASGEFVPQALADNQKFKSFLASNKITSRTVFETSPSFAFLTFSSLKSTPPSTHVLNVTKAGADIISKFDYVDTVEQDCYFKIQSTTSDPLLNELWGIKKIHAENAWDINKGLNSTIVAVSDTGVDYNHEDLKANMWVNTKEIPNNNIDDDNNGCVDDIYGCDFADLDGDPTPGSNSNLTHGTHVAGTVAAVGDNSKGITGVVQQAKIMALKGFNSFGQGDGSALLQTIYYAVNNGAKVINCSWGRKGSPSSADIDAFKYAYSRGVVVVVAAGNSNADASGYTPANIENVITVAATDSSDQIATFSNWGTTIELAAPGGKGYDSSGNTIDGILSTLPNNKYGKYIGTSMAAPHVAGLATLILSINPTLSPDEVLKIMKDSGDTINVTTSGSGRQFTYKRINAFKAANQAFATVPTSNNGGICLPGQVCKTNSGTILTDDLKNAFSQGAGCGNITRFEQKKGPNKLSLSLILFLPLLLVFYIKLFLINQKQ